MLIKQRLQNRVIGAASSNTLHIQIASRCGNTAFAECFQIISQRIHRSFTFPRVSLCCCSDSILNINRTLQSKLNSACTLRCNRRLQWRNHVVYLSAVYLPLERHPIEALLLKLLPPCLGYALTEGVFVRRTHVMSSEIFAPPPASTDHALPRGASHSTTGALNGGGCVVQILNTSLISTDVFSFRPLFLLH